MILACHECGGKVSTEAAACPHCGAPVKAQKTPQWTSIDERQTQGDTTSVVLPAVPQQPSPVAAPPDPAPRSKMRLWKRLLSKPKAPRVVIMSRDSRPMVDNVITPGRTFQHATAGGFGVSFGWAMGGCAAALVVFLIVGAAGWGVYAYFSRRAAMNELGPAIPMERKISGENRCPRCDGYGVLPAQGSNVGMKCYKCNGTGIQQ